MTEPQKFKRKTIYKVHPRTKRRLKKEALLKRFADGKKAAQEARQWAMDNPQTLALSLDEKDQEPSVDLENAASNTSNDCGESKVNMDRIITIFVPPPKEEEGDPESPLEGLLCQ